MSEESVAAVVATVVTGIVTMTTLVCGVVTLYLKLRWTDKKIDDNTKLTVAGTQAAVVNARRAADSASDAKEAADAMTGRLNDTLNGTLDEKVVAIVKQHVDPVIAAIRAHSDQDERNMVEIRKALGELRDRSISSGYK